MIRHSTNLPSPSGSKHRSQLFLTAFAACDEATAAHATYNLTVLEQRALNRAQYTLPEDKISKILALASVL